MVITIEKGIFNIDNFNVLSDRDYYYFFRALCMDDLSDIQKGDTTDSKGKIIRIKADRERYKKTPVYSEEDSISLKEVFDHIKMRYRRDTNCISLSSNANVSLMYGRAEYSDKYIVTKVAKKDLGSRVFNAGEYMIDEISKVIDSYLLENKVDEITKYYLAAIENARSEEKLNEIMTTYKRELEIVKEEVFEKGITYKDDDFSTDDYLALSPKQNFEKNKIVAKLNVLNENVVPNLANVFLIRTLGNAFSSVELINYKDITEEQIIEVPKELMDSLSLLQQVTNDYPIVEEVKAKLIEHINSASYNIEEFHYHDKEINVENEYTIENMYRLTEGRVSFYDAINIYKKSFYLSKSKLRAINNIDLMSNVINEDKYRGLFEHMKNSTYGIEPLIFSRKSINKIQVSESVGLDFGISERELFDLINSYDEKDLKRIIDDPYKSLNHIVDDLKNIELVTQDKVEYYANAIVDLFDWDSLRVSSLSDRKRSHIVECLKDSKVVEVYEFLKSKGVKEKDIANALLNIVVKEKPLDTIDVKEKFSLEEFEHFIGYYRLNKAKGLKLRSYQATALETINKTLDEKQFVSTVMPTGSGKSFIALAKMLDHSDEEILYLAPNDIILGQMEKYILDVLCDESLKKSDKELIKQKFKKLNLRTYQSLLHDKRNKVLNGEETKILSKKYGLIIFDELHRTGASEWEKSVLTLVNNQDEQTKFLGVTATPIRDVDIKNMADVWAERFGYSEEEIMRNRHLAINMDLEEAIKLGYVVNPKVVQCEYSLEKDGTLERLKEKIESIEDDSLKEKELRKFEVLRRKVNEADGIEKVIGDNIRVGGKYIVFCPVINKEGVILENEDGYAENKRALSEQVIENTQKELILNIIKYRGLTNYDLKEDDSINKYYKVADSLGIQFNTLLGKYSKSKNQNELNKFEKDDPKKIKFITVINKLNEGSHAKDVNGIIWLRPIDKNSKTLFLQQLGRIIYSTEPTKPIAEKDRPIAIDIANNVFRVKEHKEEKEIMSDLDKMIIIVDWIKRHNGEIPDLNSFDKVESRHGLTLKKIQLKYSSYITNNELLNEVIKKEREETLEIIELGSKIGLWSIDFPEKTSTLKREQINGFGYDKFELSATLKDYYEQESYINQLSDQRWIKTFNMAKKYYEQHNHLLIARSPRFILEDDELREVKKHLENGELNPEWENAVNLGTWLSNQRRSYKQGTLSKGKINLLESIGMVWEPHEALWQETFNMAKKYYEQHNHLLIPDKQRFVFEDDELREVKKHLENGELNPEWENAVNLGTWISNQRHSNKKGTLSKERVDFLESIGMVWDLNIIEDVGMKRR